MHNVADEKWERCLHNLPCTKLQPSHANMPHHHSCACTETEVFRVRTTPRSGTATPPSTAHRRHTTTTTAGPSPANRLTPAGAKGTSSPLARGGIPRSAVRHGGSVAQPSPAWHMAQQAPSPAPTTGGKRAVRNLFSPAKSKPEPAGTH